MALDFWSTATGNCESSFLSLDPSYDLFNAQAVIPNAQSSAPATSMLSLYTSEWHDLTTTFDFTPGKPSLDLLNISSSSGPSTNPSPPRTNELALLPPARIFSSPQAEQFGPPSASPHILEASHLADGYSAAMASRPVSLDLAALMTGQGEKRRQPAPNLALNEESSGLGASLLMQNLAIAGESGETRLTPVAGSVVAGTSSGHGSAGQGSAGADSAHASGGPESSGNRVCAAQHRASVLGGGETTRQVQRVPLGEKGRGELKAAIRAAIRKQPQLRERYVFRHIVQRT